MRKVKINTPEKTWLSLLQDALDNDVKIAMNHKYEYKGYRLGSFLIHAKKRKNKDLYNKVEALGFSYKRHSKKPNDVLENYIHGLWNDEAPFKGAYITRFNSYIRPKSKLLDKDLKEELNAVWKIKFGEKRRWKKPLNAKRRINTWKKIRYNKEINPEGKWFLGATKLKDIYYWVYARKTNKEKMNAITKYFNETEILELINQGFKMDNPYYKKPTYKRIKRDKK